MKRIALLMLAGWLSFGLGSCTNDEGDPELEILTPVEENQQAPETGA